MDSVRIGGKTRWTEAEAEAEGVGEGFRAWGRQVEGSLRWIHMDLEETSVAMADQAVVRTSSLDLEEWVRAAVEGTRAADEMEDTEVVVVGMGVRGGMTIVIVIAITMEGVMIGGEETTGVGGVAIVNAGEEVVEEVEAAVEDTEPHLVNLNINVFVLAHAVPSFTTCIA